MIPKLEHTPGELGKTRIVGPTSELDSEEVWGKSRRNLAFLLEFPGEAAAALGDRTLKTTGWRKCPGPQGGNCVATDVPFTCVNGLSICGSGFLFWPQLPHQLSRRIGRDGLKSFPSASDLS